jgi:hypothetical protein
MAISAGWERLPATALDQVRAHEQTETDSWAPPLVGSRVASTVERWLRTRRAGHEDVLISR